MIKQERILSLGFGLANPWDADAYIAGGGYDAFRRVLRELGPGRALDEIARARLRERGGESYNVATKWRSICEAEGQPKYVICNAYDADERAPIGQTLLQKSPHAIIEGMLIAAFTIGASHGIVYCRSEAAAAVATITQAIDSARERGLLGASILNSAFSFDISVVRRSAGFIGGEETALIAAISGQRALPSQQPPFLAQRGLRGRPTLVHSAETLTTLPWVIKIGGQEFLRIGTPNSSGTKIVVLDGDVKNAGIWEIALGTSIEQTIFDIGGGSASRKRIKAAHIGGPLGGCIPATLFAAPLDFDALRELGTTLGSGRLTVIGEDACIVDYAQQAASYLAAEACGKCVPCRLGTKRIATILAGIASKLGQAGDIDLMRELADNMRDASLCGFGIEAPNLVTTTLRYFPEEYHQHIDRGICPTAKCQPTRIHRYHKRAVL